MGLNLLGPISENFRRRVVSPESNSNPLLMHRDSQRDYAASVAQWR